MTSSQKTEKAFMEDEVHDYLINRGITDQDHIGAIQHISQGQPLYLSLLTSDVQGLATLTSQEHIAAADELLAHAIQHSSLPSVLLANIYYNRGLAYFSLKEHQHAIADYDRALELQPDFPAAYHSRARAYYFLNDYKRSITDFNHALALDSSNGVIYRHRGRAYYFLKEYQHALSDFNHTFSLGFDDADTYHHRGLTYFSLNEYRRAVEDFDRALILNPGYYCIYGHRGQAYFALKDYQRALADYNHALELEPDNTDIQHNRSLVAAELSQ